MKVLNNRYEILDTVGRGAAAVVYRVRDRRDGSVKVVKLLHAASAANEDTVRRFEDEFRILRGLQHPSLPEVFDYGWTQDKSRFIVMESVEGRPLDQYVRENPEDLWVILYQLCEVLTFIHSHNLLHQDVKPSNILVKRTAAFGEEMPLCVLIDFGLTHRRDAGQEVAMVGTPEYMAPEIIRGEAPLTRAVDYYSLGVSLYQLLAGDLPFTGSGRDIFDGHLNKQVQFHREKIEYAELYPHIRGLMSKDKRDRLQAFEEFKRSIIGRMTGGIDELDKAYGLARINSLGMIGKDDVWKELMEWLDGVTRSRAGDEAAPTTLVVRGEKGSGRTYLLERLMTEMSVRCTTPIQLADLARNESRGSGKSGDWKMEIWNEVCREAASDHVFVIVNGADELDSSSDEMLSHLAARADIEASTSNKPVIHFVLVSDARGLSQSSHVKTLQQRECSIASLGPQDHLNLLSAFLGATASRDAEHFRQFLESRGAKMANVIDGLVESLWEGTAAFKEGYWRFEFNSLPAIVDEKEYYRRISERLSPDERSLLFAISCSKEAILVDEALAAIGAKGDQSKVLVDRLEGLGLISRYTLAQGPGVSCRSESARWHIHDCMPRDVRIRLHRSLKRSVHRRWGVVGTEAMARVQVARQLSFHLQSMEEYKEAYRFLLVALKETMRMRGTLAVRRLVGDGDSLCAAWEGANPDAVSPRLLRRYLVKMLVISELREVNYHSICRFTEAYFTDRGDPIPLSFVPTYVRALASVAEYEKAAEILRGSLLKAQEGSVTYLQLRIEKAFLLRSTSEFRGAVSILDDVASSAWKLSDFYKCRRQIYYGIAYQGLGENREAKAAMDKAEEIALANDFAYERTLVYQVRAYAQFDGQELAEAMRTISAGIRFSSRHDLFRSQGGFYFLASAVYYSMGDFDRCLKYLSKSQRVSERLGDTKNVIVCLTRFAMIHQCLGRFGNALRYLDKVRGSYGRTLGGEDDILERQVRLEISLDAGLDRVDDCMASLGSLTREEVGAHRWGYFLLLRGRYYERCGDLARAYESYSDCFETFRETGILDDSVVAAVRLARVCRAIGERQKHEELKEYLSAALSDVESPNVAAQFSLLMLEDALAQEEPAGASFVEQCERDRLRVSEAMVKLHFDSLLYRAWWKLGAVVQARTAFERFHGVLKEIVANLPDRATADQFVVQAHIAETIDHYRSHVGKH